MDMQKHPVIRLLNAIMACLGVAAGGLVICGLLLAYAPTPGRPDGGSEGGASSRPSLGEVPAAAGGEPDEQTLLREYEEVIASGAAGVETYLSLADLWASCGEMGRAEQVLRQGWEDTDGDAQIGKALEELVGEPVGEAASARELRRDTYDGAGGLLWSHVYQYDDRGRMSGVTSYNAAGEQTGHVDVLYDTDGREIQSYSWMRSTGEGGGTVDPVIYRYDAAGRLEREELYFGGDEMDFYVVNRYDRAGRKIRSDSYDPDGTLMSYLLYEYDDSGKMARREGYAPDGTLGDYSVWAYDAEGKTTEYISYYADGEENARTTYTYDEAGNMIKMEERDAWGATVTYIQYE